MKKRSFVVVGLALYVIFVVVQLRAATVLPWVIADMPELSVQKIEGPWWHGRSEEVRYAKGPVLQAQWRWQPKDLLQGRLGFLLQVQDNYLKAEGRLHILPNNNAVLQQVEATAPAGYVFAMTKNPWLKAKGTLTLKIDELRMLGALIEHLKATLDWTDAVVDTPIGLLKLQSVYADINNTSSDNLHADIKGTAMQLKAKLDIDLKAQRLRLDGSMLPEQFSEVSQLLGQFGSKAQHIPLHYETGW